MVSGVHSSGSGRALSAKLLLVDGDRAGSGSRDSSASWASRIRG